MEPKSPQEERRQVMNLIILSPPQLFHLKARVKILTALKKKEKCTQAVNKCICLVYEEAKMILKPRGIKMLDICIIISRYKTALSLTNILSSQCVPAYKQKKTPWFILFNIISFNYNY